LTTLILAQAAFDVGVVVAILLAWLTYERDHRQ
jgi:hypothetical protein